MTDEIIFPEDSNIEYVPPKDIVKELPPEILKLIRALNRPKREITTENTIGQIAWYCHSPTCNDLHVLKIIAHENNLESVGAKTGSIMQRVSREYINETFQTKEDADTELAYMVLESLVTFDGMRGLLNVNETETDIESKLGNFKLKLTAETDADNLFTNKDAISSAVNSILESAKEVIRDDKDVTCHPIDGVEATVSKSEKK